MRLLISVLFTVLVLSPSNSAYSQDRLYPGIGSSSNTYHNTLKSIFSDAYTQDVKVRVLVTTKYGYEKVTGIRLIEDRYTIFHINLKSSVWSDSWVEVPCRDSEGNHLSTDSNRTCKQQDFSKVDTEISSISEVQIEPELAILLINIWQEMIKGSRYRVNNVFSTGGTTYRYSTFIHGMGTVYAYINSPIEETQTGKFTAIVDLMTSVTTPEINSERKAIIRDLWDTSNQFMAQLLDYGNERSVRKQNNRLLRGCEEQYRTIVENTYCWQSFLTNETVPYLFVANNQDGKYRLELIDITDKNDIKKVHIIPVLQFYSQFQRNEIISGWNYYVIQPWNITDIYSLGFHTSIKVFGYRDFELTSSSVGTEENSVVILFDGMSNIRNERMMHLDIEGSGEWFDVRELFGR